MTAGEGKLELLITTNQNLLYPQNLIGRGLAIVVRLTTTNRVHIRSCAGNSREMAGKERARNPVISPPGRDLDPLVR